MGKQAAFKTNPVGLEDLLRLCANGKIQLPDFQRSWVWDEERIKGLIASISQAFPVGALMTLEVKPGAADTFARVQLVPFAAILAMIGPKFDHAAVRDKLARWFWCGIFGELYGSAIESRFTKDVLEFPAWLDGGPVPSTITDGRFRPERLRTLRTRLSAAYKGIHALMMAEGAIDFRSGQPFGQTVFFDEYVDIHHIFPQDWCKKQKIDPKVFDTVINKSPLSYKTNRILGGIAPSVYLDRLETGGKDAPPIAREALDQYLASHATDPALLRADDFPGFMEDREARLLAMISQATGHAITRADAAPEEGEDVPQDDEGFDLPAPDTEEAA